MTRRRRSGCPKNGADPAHEADSGERNRNFKEVEQGYSPAEAVAEAERCLRCYRVVTLSV